MAQDVLKLVEGADWESLGGAQKPADWERRLTETMNLLTNSRGLPRHAHEYMMREVLTTADFPLLFGDVLDRQMIALYQATPAVWKQYMKARPTVKDFRTASDFQFTGGDNELDVVPEKGEYQASPRDELRYTIAALKYGRQFDISWESIINDDLQALRDTPVRFSKAASNTEHRLAVTQYANDVGAHVEGAGGNLYQVGVNSGAGGALTIANLETGIEAMAAFTDVNGEAVPVMPRFLVVPPALKLTAQQIITSTHKMWTDDAGGVLVASPTTNVVSQAGLELIVDPYLQIVNAGGTGATGWYLFADPSDVAALGYAHLAGHEQPEIVMKDSNKVSVGGGALGPMSGDFTTDNIFYRVRLVFGVASYDWRGTYQG